MTMSKVDLVVKNGRIVTPTDILEAGVAVDDGKIVSIARETNLPESEKTIDATGLLIFPGAIDQHVHILPPQRGYRKGPAQALRKGNFETETISASFGGVTSVMDFINNEPADDPLANLENGMKEASSKSVIDFSFHFGTGQGWDPKDAVRYVDEAFDRGLTSVKARMCYRKQKCMADDDLLYVTLQQVAKRDGVYLIHAENGLLVDYLMDKYVQEGRFGPKTQLEARPSWLEEEAVKSSLVLAREAGARAYIVHLTSKGGLEAILDARSRGQTVHIEVTPYFLFFTQEDTEKYWPLSRETPCFRTKADNEALWQAIIRGQVDTIGTDHSQNTSEMKKMDDRVGGLTGVEVVFPLMYSECVKRGLTPSQVTSITSYNAARIFKLPGKGLVSVGCDADLVLLDPKKEMVVRADKLHSKCDFTLFEGWRIKGVPVTIIRRGEVIVSKGEFHGKPGSGRFLGINKERNKAKQ